jgi:hypothetical protein
MRCYYYYFFVFAIFFLFPFSLPLRSVMLFLCFAVSSCWLAHKNLRMERGLAGWLVGARRDGTEIVLCVRVRLK